MNDLTRQQLCAALGISESTVRRLELLGLPCTPIGSRSKRYNLTEVKQWLRENQYGRASISLVQRHLRIGYNRAARLVEQMERFGVVSPMDSSGSRKVLMAA